MSSQIENEKPVAEPHGGVASHTKMAVLAKMKQDPKFREYLYADTWDLGGLYDVRASYIKGSRRGEKK